MLFHPGHEAVGGGAIDHPMVEREAQVTHGANRDGIVDDDSTLLHRPYSEDGSLRWIDDGGAEEAAEAAVGGDGEGAVLDCFGS